jgi:hypothetical protein
MSRLEEAALNVRTARWLMAVALRIVVKQMRWELAHRRRLV